MNWLWKTRFGLAATLVVFAVCTIQAVRGQYYRAHKPRSYTDYYNDSLRHMQAPQTTPRYQMNPSNYFARPAPSNYNLMQRNAPNVYYQQFVRPVTPNTTAATTPSRTTTSGTTTAKSSTATSRTSTAGTTYRGTPQKPKAGATNYYHHFYGGRAALGLPP